MRNAYKILAFVLAAEIVVQAMAVVYAMAGLFVWIDSDGGTLDKAAIESEDISFTGAGGFILHGINGMMVIPLVALALLVVAFFAKVPRGVPVAGTLLGLVVVQVLLGLGGHSVPFIGALHGLVALLIFAGALHAGRLAAKADTSAGETSDVVRA
jgi:hypothetical protein